MKKFIFFVLLILSLFPSAVFSQGWFEQSTGLSAANTLYGVWFVNANTGFISGGTSSSRVIKKSTDGGTTWSNSYFEIDPATFYSLQFLNETTGFVYGYESEVFRTTNAGANWVMIYIGSNGVFSGEFLDYNTGIICGLNYVGSNIHKTTNAGASWTTLNTPLAGQQFLLQVFFRNANTAFLSSSSYTTSVPNILRTSDGGSNWNFVFTGTASQVVFKISDINSDTMIAVAQAGNILRTYNAGVNWAGSSFGSYNLNNIAMTNNLHAYAVGQNVIIKTTNTGNNWNVQYTPSSDLQAVFFLNDQTGWACGTGGKLYKTTSGGVTAVNHYGNTIPGKFELKQNYPNPFNPSTHLKFDISESRFVNLKIYDMLGKELSTIVNEELSPGIYEVEWDGSNYPSGVYFYRLETPDFSQTRKMILLK